MGVSIDQQILEEEFTKLAQRRSTGSILGVSFESFLDSEDIQNLLAEDAGILEDITEIWMVG